MKTWIRVVIPVNWIAMLLLAYAGIQIAGWFVDRQFIKSFPLIGILLCPVAFAYGVYRVAAFHPVLRPEYFAWLKRTPWMPHHPLPLGPIHVMPQDVLVAGILALLAYPNSELPPVAIPLVMLAPYLTMVCFTCLLCEAALIFLLMSFGLGLFVRLLPNVGPLYTVAGSLLVLSRFGLQTSLAAFRNNARWHVCDTKAEITPQNTLGWPFDWLQPFPKHDEIDSLPGIIISLLTGWWFYAIMSHAQVPDIPFFICGLICFLLVVVRLHVYCKGYSPPISFWGRLFTFRWIIPRYDQIFVAPLATIAIMVLSAKLFSVQWKQIPVVCGTITFTLMLFATLVVGPRLKQWRLTGNHRITHTFSNSQRSFTLGATKKTEQQEFIEI